MPLDLTGYEPDIPEVAALKEKVRKVAKKYTDRHGWCSTVETALKEMGIGDAKALVVNVTTTHPFTLPVPVDPAKLFGLDEAAQKAVVLEAMGGEVAVRGTAPGVGSGTLAITLDQIASLSNNVSPARGATGEAAGNGWFYASDQGRVLHYFRNARDVGDSDNSLCGVHAAQVRTVSPASTGGRCLRCQERS